MTRPFRQGSGLVAEIHSNNLFIKSRKARLILRDVKRQLARLGIIYCVGIVCKQPIIYYFGGNNNNNTNNVYLIKRPY